MQINTFSLVYREKVTLCSFIPIQIRGQILSWLLHLAMSSRILRHLQEDCVKCNLLHF